MADARRIEDLEVGFDIPAQVGMAEHEVQTPCLILDLDALERNVRKMGDYAKAHGMRHRVHGKMHKSVDVAKLQIEIGGADGVCCQKVSEAEAFVRSDIKDVLISNQVRDRRMIDRLAKLPDLGSEVSVCIDDPANAKELSDAASRHGTSLNCLVEIDCGAGRCGVTTPADAVAIAREIDAAPGLTFAGVQAYQGRMQHLPSHPERLAAFDRVMEILNATIEALTAAGLPPDLITGAGTGSYRLESESGVYNELQCGSYAFMDADYGRILDQEGNRLDQGEWENALFLLTSVMSKTRPGTAVCDAGLKVQSVDSGLPLIFGRSDIEYRGCSDEHGVISDPADTLKVNDRLRLVPGHCDPTCNLHDWYVGVRNGKVECLWPVSARGKAW